MRQRRKKENACWSLLCCLCNSIIEAEKGERSPPKSPSKPQQAQPNITGPSPKVDGSTQQVDADSIPPVADDTGPAICPWFWPMIEMLKKTLGRQNIQQMGGLKGPTMPPMSSETRPDAHLPVSSERPPVTPGGRPSDSGPFIPGSGPPDVD